MRVRTRNDRFMAGLLTLPDPYNYVSGRSRLHALSEKLL
jgi:hypothetical protein